jgi:hypothetical protein
VIRDGNELRLLNLDYPTEDDLERGAIRNYDYVWRAHDAPTAKRQDPGAAARDWSDSDAVSRLRLRVLQRDEWPSDASAAYPRDDMWIKDNVDLYIRPIRQRTNNFDTLAWIEDRDWTYIASWTQDVAMSTDSTEGFTTWNLRLT